jgi:hypothetical protein
MLLEVRDGEDFPADLLCLHCASPNHVCYVKTTNLDGPRARPATLIHSPGSGFRLPWPHCHIGHSVGHFSGLAAPAAQQRSAGELLPSVKAL